MDRERSAKGRRAKRYDFAAFRGYRGLYKHLEQMVPALAKHGFDDIVLNSCITSENVGEISRLADKARAWEDLCFAMETLAAQQAAASPAGDNA